MPISAVGTTSLLSHASTRGKRTPGSAPDSPNIHKKNCSLAICVPSQNSTGARALPPGLASGTSVSVKCSNAQARHSPQLAYSPMSARASSMHAAVPAGSCAWGRETKSRLAPRPKVNA